MLFSPLGVAAVVLRSIRILTQYPIDRPQLHSDNHNFELLVWTNEPLEIPVTQSDLCFQVWDELVEEDVGLPLPALDLYVGTVPPEMVSNGSDGSVSQIEQRET